MADEFGRQYYDALRGSWRAGHVAPARLSGAVLEAAQHAGELSLLGRFTTATGAAARLTRQAIRDDRAQRLRREHEIVALVGHFRAAGIEPILLKGWSSARHYADQGARPLGDIDVAVDPRQIEAALSAITTAPVDWRLVDLHAGVPDVPGERWARILARSILVALRGTPIRVLGPIDELRQLSIHFWRHCGRRAKWLCDVAGAVESYRADFPWDDLFDRDWEMRICRAVVGLASELLGAEIIGEPRLVARFRAPSWLTAQVLRQPAQCLPPARAEAFSPTLVDRFRGVAGDPMRTVLRARLSPYVALPAIRAAGVMLRPYQMAVRVNRRLNSRRRSVAPNLHDSRIF